jgi:hypothetical protein
MSSEWARTVSLNPGYTLIEMAAEKVEAALDPADEAMEE